MARTALQERSGLSKTTALSTTGKLVADEQLVKITGPGKGVVRYAHNLLADHSLTFLESVPLPKPRKLKVDSTKFVEYVKKLDAESDRMIVQSIGKTAEGRDQLMAIITAPENFKKLDRYKEISARLSHA